MSHSSNNAILAKARAMYGRRLTPEQYDAMMKCKTVSETAGYLKNQTHFREALSSIAESNIHRGQLENLLHRAAFEDYSRLYHYLTTTHESLFSYVVKEAEIKEILRMVLLLKADNAKSFILDLPGYLISKASVDLMAVAHATTFDELIKSLANSDYAVILKRFQPSPDHPLIDYVGCEHEFYDYLYSKLFRLLEKQYSGSERKELEELLKLRVEMLNLNHIVRCKTFLNTPNADIVRSLYPYYYRIKQKQFNEMIDAKDQEALTHLLEKTPYYRRFSAMEYPYIEDYTNRMQHAVCQKALHFSTHASVVFYAYVTLSQQELSNVVNIIEGIRYQIPESELKNLIVIS